MYLNTCLCPLSLPLPKHNTKSVLQMLMTNLNCLSDQCQRWHFKNTKQFTLLPSLQNLIVHKSNDKQTNKKTSEKLFRI